jgi:bacteriocin biosynthesis cyclodehydratase domain-containing protein
MEVQSESDRWANSEYIGRIFVVASWRPAPELCTPVHQMAQLCKRPFVPFFADGRVLQLGPVTVPEAGPCWVCSERRASQHDPSRQLRSAVLAYYAANPHSGPKGFLTPFSMIGAVRLSQTIDALDAKAASAGQLWRIDMITREMRTGMVVGVHGCSYCGLHRRPETRSYAEMQKALAYLWSSDNSYAM